jgi:hypothetical protein
MGRQVNVAVTDSGGNYRINTDKMDSGTYTLRALKMVNVTEGKLWASPNDVMDIASNKNQEPIKVEVPPSNPNGVEIEIECLTRGEIFKDTGAWQKDVPGVPK